jgi:Leu/Phe-tRNA-protein transferase
MTDPALHAACNNEILAELAPEQLLWAYSQGVFPMYC